MLWLVALLTSCAVGKQYKRPDIAIPSTYYIKPQITADTVLLPWRTFFKDPQLVSLIGQALERNNDVAIALINVEQLENSYKQAKQSLLPALELGVGASRNWPSKSSLNGSLSDQFTGKPYLDDYSAILRTTWEADIWGKAKMQREGASADYFAQRENLEALKTRMIVQVAQAYYNLVSLDEQLNIAHQNVALSDSTLAMLRLQFNAGQINSLAVEQAEAQKKTAELIMPLTRQNIAVQESALSILCGSYPTALERATGLATVMPAEEFTYSVPAHLLSRRPDLKAAEYAVVSANAKTGLSRAAMYPSLSLSPSFGMNSFKFSTWFNLPGALTQTLAANLTQPIFQRRSLKTAYQNAVLEQEKSVTQFKTTMMTAVKEVTDAMAKYSEASQRLILVQQKKQSLDKATGDALKLYKSGMATYLEVLTAQNNKLQNDLEVINIRLEKLTALTDLYRALGGGIQ